MSKPDKAMSTTEVVSVIGVVLGLLTAWLYVAGWSYAYTYFDRFRIPLLMVEMPRDHFLVYGGLVTLKLPWLPVALFFGFGALFVARARFRASVSSATAAFVLAACCVLLFFLAHAAGGQAARADFEAQRMNDYAAYPRVALKPMNETIDAASWALLQEGCAKLVLANQSRVFLVVPRRDASAIDLATLVVPLSEVASLTVSGIYESCP